MPLTNTITLLSNGLTLTLSLAFLIIVLWHNARKALNWFFAIHLLLVILWNVGSLLALVAGLVGFDERVIRLCIMLMELGFTASSVSAYALTALLTGFHTRRFQLLALISLAVVIIYQLFLMAADAPIIYDSTEMPHFRYRFQISSTIFYLIFGGTTLYLTWRYRRKIRSRDLTLGIGLFVLAQSAIFLNPDLEIVSLSTITGGIATLVTSFAILRQEIITPLAEHINQVEAVHKVSLAIIRHIAFDQVLTQITSQAARWLDADAAGIFLKHNAELVLTNGFNLPRGYVGFHIPSEDGIAGKVLQTQKSIFLENFSRDWEGKPDLPLSLETFGSVIVVPLVYGSSTIGALMVITGKQGRLFQVQDVKSLELFGAQAAIAIAHSRLFADQQELTQQIEKARSQLEAILTSTENPIIAIDRRFRLILANPAARELFHMESSTIGEEILQHLPRRLLPPDYHQALRKLYTNRAYTYEVSLDGKAFLCHIAQLGRPRIEGWVAILHDVTQLKELDRLKSEMIRMTSHDLKNPLQAAMANLELLHEDLQAYGNSEVQAALSTINKQLSRMNRIISGILDLERAKTVSQSKEVFPPEPIINRAIENVRELAADKAIELSVQMDNNLPEFACIPEQFEQALVNLLENAIKFTSAGGNVTLHAKHSENHLEFTVEDTGIGIAPEMQPFVFDRFWRGGQKGQAGAEHISGTGLGLSLVKAIVENHQGEVWLSSIMGKGSSFHIRVPAPQPNPTALSQL
jgi:PAS domain S-box-containing protein